MKNPNAKTYESLYTPQFLLLCASNFLFAASFQMLIPELPDHLKLMGGAEYKGYILALFTLTAGISRPFSGKLTDTVGRVPVMVFGALVCVVCSALYPFATSILGFLMLRLGHGFSTGFKPTATAAYVADMVQLERRGEAMSGLGISGSLGMTVGPVLSSPLTRSFGIDSLFAVSAIFALFSVVILVKHMPETLKDKKPFTWKTLRIQRHEIFEPKALPTFWVQLGLAFSSGAVLTLSPDFTQFLGSTNKGLFFSMNTLAALFIRIVAGKMSDKYGRVLILRCSSLVMCISLIILAFAADLNTLIFAALLYGLSWGMNTPTLQAWVVDLTETQHRGRGLATLFIGLEMGIGLGAWLSQALYGNDISRINQPFLLSALFSALAFGYLTFQKNKINLT
jgi:MFS family permease